MLLFSLACSDPETGKVDSGGEDTGPGDTDSGTGTAPFDPSFTGWEDCRLAVDVGSMSGGGPDDKMVYAPSVMADEFGYTMWFSAASEVGETAIAMTTSVDGVSWADPVMVFGPGMAGDTDAVRISTPSVLNDPEVGWRMYYDGVGVDQLVRIHMCTSPDGRVWSECVPVKEPGDLPGIDDNGVEIPFVLHDEDVWRLYYSGVKDPIYEVLYSTSTDGVAWNTGQELVPAGSQGEYDAIATYSPYVWRDGDHYRLLYTGRTPDTSSEDSDWEVKRLISAVSTDGENWTDFTLSMDLGCEGAYDAWRADEAAVLKVEGGWRLWYDGFDDPDFSKGIRRILTAFRPD